VRSASIGARRVSIRHFVATGRLMSGRAGDNVAERRQLLVATALVDPHHNKRSGAMKSLACSQAARRQRIRPFVAAALCLVAILSPTLSKAELLSYTLSGGLISGTLGGTPFTAANWTITATANSSAAQFLPENSGTGGSIYAPVWYQTVTPAISIASGSSVLTATLTGTGQWFLESRDYSVFGTPNDGAVGFFYSRIGEVEDGSGAYVGGLIGLNNLQTTGTVNGQGGFDNGSGGIVGFSTSAGELVIASDTGAAGTFVTVAPEVTAVPEIDPSSLGSVLALVLGSLGLLERRRLKAA